MSDETSSSIQTAPDQNLTTYPPGIPYIIGNEGAERFSYYGMKAILYTYVAGLLMQYGDVGPELASKNATQIKHLFVAGVYFTGLVGGILADRWWGKYATILRLSLLYTVGHGALALFENPSWQQSVLGTVWVTPIQGLGIGLLLICIGAGGIKPCVSAHVGDQFGRSNWHLVQHIFNAFYFIINFGSFFSTLIIPAIRGAEIRDASDTLIGYTGSVSWAFAIPGILMGIATMFFYGGRGRFVHVPPTPGGRLGFLDFLSGFFMAAAFGFPIWFAPVFGTSWQTTILICALLIAAFAISFWARQRIQPDNGFLAVMVFTMTRPQAIGIWLRIAAIAVGISIPFIFWIYELPWLAIIGGGVGGLLVTALIFKLTPIKEASSTEGQTANDTASTSTLSKPGQDVFGMREHPFWKQSVEKFGLEAAQGPRAVLGIMSVFIFVSVFWALFDQHSSTWIEQARHMNRLIDMSIGGWAICGLGCGVIFAWAMRLMFTDTAPRVRQSATLAGALSPLLGLTAIGFFQPEGGYVLIPEQMSALNPAMVMLLIPITARLVYPYFAEDGQTVKPLVRMSWGMVVTALSFVASALIQMWIDSAQAAGAAAPHILWQLIPYLILTAGEVMVSITGLEFAYTQAPRSMKSVVMSFWYLNVTLGQLLVVFLAGFESLSAANFFWVFAGFMMIAAVAFGLRARHHQYVDFTQ